MAVGGDTTYIAGGLFQHIERQAIVAFNDAAIAVPLTNQVGVPAASTVAWDVVNNGTNTIGSADVAEVTEGTEITDTLMNTTKKTATLLRYAVRLDLYGKAKLANVTDPEGKMGPLVGNAMGAKLDALVAAEMDNFTTSVGVSTIAITVDNIFSAIQTAKTGGAIGPMNLLLHPKQVWGVHGFSNDVVTSQQFGGTPNKSNEMLDTGNLLSIGGVPLNITREFTETSSAIKGGLFVPDAVGTGWAGPLISVEVDSQPTFDLQAWVAFSMFDAQMLNANWGAEIWTLTTAL